MCYLIFKLLAEVVDHTPEAVVCLISKHWEEISTHKKECMFYRFSNAEKSNRGFL